MTARLCWIEKLSFLQSKVVASEKDYEVAQSCPAVYYLRQRWRCSVGWLLYAKVIISDFDPSLLDSGIWEGMLQIVSLWDRSRWIHRLWWCTENGRLANYMHTHSGSAASWTG
uniref:Uncharacterized protein n=1 Tax=Linum usitatissimum TaxID=4006 RepID=A0A165G184_LINUS|nr:hypothetical protein [Linum usitatissimum]